MCKVFQVYYDRHWSVLNLVWIPVGIKDDDSVGGLEVQSEAASSSAENEKKDLRMRIIEHREQLSTIIALCRPIKTQVLVTYTFTARSLR